MTDNRLRILADGLFDGGLAADVAPKDLRAAVSLLSAAGRPGSAAELATMAARVRQFSVEVNAASTPSTIRTPSLATASSNPAVSYDINRSNPMFATRITRKAMSIFAITVLAAGTAAAAAGGALPMFEEDSTEVVVDDNNDETNVVEDGSHKSDDESAGGESDDESSEPADDEGVENQNGDVDHHGKCTAWTNGSAKNATNPAFAELQVAADAAAVSIDEYCATFLGTPGDDDESDDDESDDKGKSEDKGKSDEDHGKSDDGESDESEESDESDESDDSENNGNSGNGNSGSNNGNSGSNNGNSGSNNGNSGNGNSGKGRGNSKD